MLLVMPFNPYLGAVLTATETMGALLTARILLGMFEPATRAAAVDEEDGEGCDGKDADGRTQGCAEGGENEVVCIDTAVSTYLAVHLATLIALIGDHVIHVGNISAAHAAGVQILAGVLITLWLAVLITGKLRHGKDIPTVFSGLAVGLTIAVLTL